MGCLVAGSRSDLCNGTYFLLTPPLEPLGNRLETYLRARPATQVLENTDLAARRSDGSTTLVSRQFFDELSLVENPVDIFCTISNPVHIIIARNDNVVDYLPDSAEQICQENVFSVDTDHDLSGPARNLVLDYIQQQL